MYVKLNYIKLYWNVMTITKYTNSFMKTVLSFQFTISLLIRVKIYNVTFKFQRKRKQKEITRKKRKDQSTIETANALRKSNKNLKIPRNTRHEYKNNWIDQSDPLKQSNPLKKRSRETRRLKSIFPFDLQKPLDIHRMKKRRNRKTKGEEEGGTKRRRRRRKM